MNVKALTDRVSTLAASIAADPRWEGEKDDLGDAILGMLLYGYALALGRLVMLLDEEQIKESVVLSLVATVGAARRWSEGLAADAARSAFDKHHHPGNYQLVGVGHSYHGVTDQAVIINNAFQNIAAFRKVLRVATSQEGPPK